METELWIENELMNLRAELDERDQRIAMLEDQRDEAVMALAELKAEIAQAIKAARFSLSEFEEIAKKA